MQTSPSLHELLSGSHGYVHAPVLGLHVPAPRHVAGAGQVTVVPPVHTPAWQVSPEVHALPSSQLAPVFATQVPVAAEQV